MSFDASKEMVRKCKEYPHAFCLNISFEDLDFKEEFDGVWCCGALLHLSVEKGKEAVKRLATSLKVGGVMLLSLKVGEGHKKQDGRFYQYYDESSVRELYEGDSRLEIVNMWVSESLVPTEERNWLNLLLRRKRLGFTTEPLQILDEYGADEMSGLEI